MKDPGAAATGAGAAGASVSDISEISPLIFKFALSITYLVNEF